MKFSTTLLLMFMALTITFAQNQNVLPELEVTMKNFEKQKDKLYFDVFLHAVDVTKNASQEIYLGHTDIIVKYNTYAFSSPMLLKDGNNCSLTPSNSGQGPSTVTQMFYNSGTSTSIGDGLMRININAPTATSSQALNNNVAKVDQQENIHKLGRFYITGFKGVGTPGFELKTEVPKGKLGLISIAHTIVEGTASNYSERINIRGKVEYNLPAGDLTEEPLAGLPGVEAVSEESLEAKLFPNPAISDVNITWNTNSKIQPDQVLILDLQGNVIYQQDLDVPAGQWKFDSQKVNFASGQYTVQLLSNKRSIWNQSVDIIR